ncbi:MAG: 30S ribosome-binding factor RbfA [Candidatus Kapabacteria bacterium]|nr:30S ribosome-binding factor RbfA [Candidatus Kapabacteria bacterium]
MSIRTEKLASEIKKALSRPLQDFAYSNGGGMITITSVVVSPDGSVAKLHISIFANSAGNDNILRKLNEEHYFLNRVLATQVRLRIIPELRFYLDDSLDQIEHISNILKSNPPLSKETDESEGVQNSDDGNEDSE